MHEYRNSKNSRYGELLTGLTLYNLGRSHSHHHNHYYNDNYYNRRYGSSSGVENRPTEEATCLLRIKENNQVEMLKIPCEIVSTFTEDSKKYAPISDTLLNQNVCTNNTTMINNTLPVNDSSVNSTSTANTTMVHVTVCTTSSTVSDPLAVKGPPAYSKNMECEVEIITKQALLRKDIDCGTLISYAKMPEPKKNTGMLPSREKLKSWLSKPPWWASMFIAVYAI